MPLLLSPMSPSDANVPTGIDFSNVLAAEETLASVVSVTATPSTITVGPGAIVDGNRPSCMVQFTLGAGQVGQSYTVTATVTTTDGVTLARSCTVPVSIV